MRAGECTERPCDQAAHDPCGSGLASPSPKHRVFGRTTWPRRLTRVPDWLFLPWPRPAAAPSASV